MGGNSEKTFYYTFDESTGKFELIGYGDIADFEIDSDEDPDVPKVRRFPTELETHWPIEVVKFFYCKTRKRYVKKLMGLGVPRNTANEWAKLVSRLRVSYHQALLYDWFSGRATFWLKAKMQS